MRFRLGTMLVLMTLAALCLATIGYIYRQQRDLHRRADEMLRQAQEAQRHAEAQLKQKNNPPSAH
jgi:uncharacterized protein HemX